MKHLLVALLLASSTASAASWESFPLRDNGSVAVWTVAGPLPNTRALSHGESCVGFEKDYLVATGGESAAVPAEGDVVIDVPGNRVAWMTAFSDPAGLLDYFASANVKYLIMGVNPNPGLPVFNRPTPFWWESPSGKRVLALRNDHYATGNYWRLHDGDLDAVEKGLPEYLASLSDRDYPFEGNDACLPFGNLGRR